METTIKLKPTELNSDLFQMLVSLIDQKGFTDISISLTKQSNKKSLRHETPQKVKQRIEAALADIEAGDRSQLISFSPEEFETFSRTLSKK